MDVLAVENLSSNKLLGEMMRRKDRELPVELIPEVMEQVLFGTLATVNKDGVPYSLPISYVYDGKAVYVHGTTTGQKIDNIMANPNVSFSVVTDVETLPDKFSTKYKSVIITGTAEIIPSDAEEWGYALKLFLDKYSADFMEPGMKYINSANKSTAVIKINVDQLTAKGHL